MHQQNASRITHMEQRMNAWNVSSQCSRWSLCHKLLEPDRMSSLKFSVPSVIFCAVVGSAIAQDMTTATNTTNTTNTKCVQSTYKFYSPNHTSPTFVYIRKSLAPGVSSCVVGTMINAICNNASMGPLVATAGFPSASPSCSWSCALGCTIVTDGSSDGLPVELMGFSVENIKETQ
jgi:hypothetical protein